MGSHILIIQLSSFSWLPEYQVLLAAKDPEVKVFGAEKLFFYA